MSTVTTAADPTRHRRVELILRQIESLPTLPAVALKLLSLTTSSDSNAGEVIELVKSDPSITARLLSLARKSDLGVSEVTSIDHAVKLLGFSAVRNAVLSIKVFETFSEAPQAEADADLAYRFDRKECWRHGLAVGICAELIAAAHRRCGVDAGDAFVCGLLHDIGKVALDHVLPRAYAKIIELVELNQGNIAEFERRVVGIDHQTAGKRLAEQWGLPHRVQDCIWLHGSPYRHLPQLEHRKLIGLISLADLIVRRQHIGYSGNFLFNQDVPQLIAELELEPDKVEAATTATFEELHRRSDLMGLDDQPSRELYIQSIQHANEALGRLNAALDRRARAVDRQAAVLTAIQRFQTQQTPGRSVQDQLTAVVESAAGLLGTGRCIMLHQSERGEPWLMCRFNLEGTLVETQLLDAPANAQPMDQLDADVTDVRAALPWLSDVLPGEDLSWARVLPLSCGWGVAALMLHDRSNLPPRTELAAVTLVWGSTIAAAQQHEGARWLGEQLAEANRELAETQDRLLRNASLVRLGEMAAGAAHEMNNPLTVISGRSQLLASRLSPGSDEQKAAATIVDQTHRLSDLITSLRMYADPPRANRKPVTISTLLDEAVREVREQLPEYQSDLGFSMKMASRMPVVSVDAVKLKQAVKELLLNAAQAHPKSAIQVTVRTDSSGELLVLQVIDDGEGMDANTLAHAMDPFFSSKPAGRRVGMGLPRAQQLAAAHGGHVELRSQAGQGTTATLMVPLDSPE